MDPERGHRKITRDSVARLVGSTRRHPEQAEIV